MESAKTVTEYVQKLPKNRVEPFSQLLETIRTNIDPKFEERIIYNMPGWVIPFSIYPQGYKCDNTLPVPFLNLGNQKGHIALYHLALYQDLKSLRWFEQAYKETGLKLNMGKSCIRFTAMSNIPYQLIGELVRRISLKDYLKIV